ncbi:MAG: M23 family metallopeptidase [Prevotellaceae bacterium]|jgi:hypothetical protein|nr:M23 family metallopeptidase [Prevotellaceae bacterium]
MLYCAFPALQAQGPAYYRLPLDSNMTLSLAGNFGEPRENHFHSGVDFRVGGQPGARLYAVAGGYVSRISVSPGGYGKAIYIKHPNGATSVYAHLHTFPSKIKKYIERIQYRKQRFAVNEYLDSTLFPVKKGQVVGIAGNSGNSFGAHLHFELRETATDKTLNMIKGGVYRTPDNIPPKIHNIVFYEYGKSSGIPEISPYSLYVIGNIRKENVVTVPDTFFVAVDVDDRQNGPSGVLGVNRLVVKLDKEVIFAYRMDGFLFEDTKYINSLMAYDWWITQKRPLVKTYLEPGNKLLYVYDKVVNNGLVTLSDSLVHIMEVIAYDDVGNTSLVAFNVRKRKPAVSTGETITNEADKPFEVKKVPMFHDSLNVFHERGLKVTVPAGGLYRPVWFTADTLPRPNSACSAYWRIHTAETPLHHAAQIHLPADVPKHLQSKAVVASYNSKGKITSSGGTWDGDGVGASISSFGDYFVALDTVPPLIEPQFARRANLKRREKLSVKITDNLSGIGSYSATIDGNWALMEYDAKDNMLEYFFDPARLKRDQTHTLVVTVKDKRLNVSTFETDFIW